MWCTKCGADLVGDPFINILGQGLCPQCGSINDITEDVFTEPTFKSEFEDSSLTESNDEEG